MPEAPESRLWPMLAWVGPVLLAGLALQQALAMRSRPLAILAFFLVIAHVGAMLNGNKYATRAMLLVDSILLGIAAWMLRDRLFVFDYDTWIHLGLARRTLEFGAFPGDVLAGAATPAFYSVLHFIVAGIGKLTGMDLRTVWSLVAVAGIMGWCVSSYLLARICLRNRMLALMAALLAVLATAHVSPFFTYPFYLSFVFFQLTICCRLQQVETAEPTLPKRILPPVLVGMTIATHLFAGVTLCLLLGVFELMRLKQKSGLKAWIADVAYLPIGVVLGAPFILNVVRQMGGATNAFQYVAGNEYVQLGDSGWLMFDIVSAIEPFWLPMILAIPGLLVLWTGIAKAKDQPPISGASRLWLSVAFLVPITILATPLVTVMIKLTGAHHTPRMVYFIPIGCLASLALFACLDGRFLPIWPRRLALAAVLSLILLPTISSIHTQWERSGRYAVLNDEFTPDFEAFAPYIHGKVVLSDPETSYLLPFFTGASVVAVQTGHTSPYTDPAPRLKAVKTLLSAGSSDVEISDVLDSWNVDFVLVNRKPSVDAESAQFIAFSRHYSTGTEARLLKHPRLLLVQQTAGMLLFSVLRQPATGGG